jgi:triacylglycerol esterase/lipase EstA (alpha/beta hydrolase family)
MPSQPAPSQPDRLSVAGFAPSRADLAPEGTNDFSCTPSAEKPYPVMLVHGTESTAYDDYAAISPMLRDEGYCVFALNYGGKPGSDVFGTEDVYASAAQVGLAVQRVLDATGAAQVDVIGYSQGANVSRYWVNKLGGAAVTHTWVGLASPTYGGTLYGLTEILTAEIPFRDRVVERVSSRAVVQLEEGSEFNLALNAGGDTVPGPQYVTIGTRMDEVIQPFSNIALRGPGARNLVLQDLCPVNFGGHFLLPYDAFTQDVVRLALDPTSQPRIGCSYVARGTGLSDQVRLAVMGIGN